MKKLLTLYIAFSLLPLFASAQTTGQFFPFLRWTNATGTSATTTNFFATNASTTNLFGSLINGFGLSTCNGTNALGWASGIFSCVAIPQGTVTAIGVTTANGVSGVSSGGATPNLTITLGAITPSSVVSAGLGEFANLWSNGSSTLQNFTGLNSTTTNATTTSLNVSGAFSASSAVATSSITNALQIGGTAGDHALTISAGRAYPASVTTGGMVSINNGSTNPGPALEVTSAFGAGATGRGIVFNQTNPLFDQDFFIASSSAVNTTVFNIKGAPTGKGVLKIEHTGNGTGYANGSALSIDLVNASDAQGIFIKDSVGGTGKLLNLVDSSSGSLASIDSSGNLILKGDSTTTSATTTNLYVSNNASTSKLFLSTGAGCLQVTNGQVLSTGSNCGSGSGAVSSVTANDSTLTISPTTGAVLAALNLGQGNIWTAASSTFVNGVTFGTSTTTSATTTNFNTTNASTSRLYVSNSPSALLLTDTTGLVGKYGGASACGSNNFVTALSGVGGTTCGTATISGISLGSNLASHTHDSTLTGTSYNGSAAVSDWGIDLTHANTWTGGQIFTNATASQATTTSLFGVLLQGNTLRIGGSSTTTINSTGDLLVTGSTTLQNFTAVNSTSTSATTTNFNVSGAFTSSSAVATSSITNALQIGGTARDSALTVTAGRVYPASVTTGGMIHIDNSTVNSGPALEVVSGFGASATGRGIVFNETNAAFDQDFILASSSAGNTTTFNIKGTPTGKGILKIEHTGNGASGFSNSAALSIDLLNAGDAQGVFIKDSVGGIGKMLNIVDSSSVALASIDSSGNLILKGNSTTTNATTTALAISSIASGNCLHTTTGGAIVGTGSDCGAGGGGASNSKFATTSDTRNPNAISPNGGNNTLVGVGTSTPAFQLESASSSGPQLGLSDGLAADNHWTLRNAGGLLYFATASPSTFATSSVSALTIDGNGNTTIQNNLYDLGNVGVGTTSPQKLLHVVGNQSQGIVRFERIVGATGLSGTQQIYENLQGTIGTDESGPTQIFGIHDNNLPLNSFNQLGDLGFATNSTEGTTTGDFILRAYGKGAVPNSLSTIGALFFMDGATGQSSVGTTTAWGATLSSSTSTAPQFSLVNGAAGVNAKNFVMDWTGTALLMGTSSDSTTSTSTALSLAPAGSAVLGVGSSSPTAKISIFTGGDLDSYATLPLSNVFDIGSSTKGTSTTTLVSILSNGLAKFINILTTGSTTLQNFTATRSTTTNATTTSFGITGTTGCSGANALTTDSNGTVLCGAVNSTVYYATTSKVTMATTTVSFPSDIQNKEYLKITVDSVQPVIIGTTPSVKFMVNNDFGNKLSYRISTGDGSSYNSSNATNNSFQMGAITSPQIVHLEYTFRNSTTSPKLMTYQGFVFATSTGAMTNYFGQVIYNRVGQATSTQFSFDDGSGNTQWPVGTEIRVVGY